MMFLLGLIPLLIACGPDPKDPALEAANQLHLEALAISDSLEGYLSASSGARWDSLREAHSQWESGLVEVPGFEHDHDHDHDHEHHHHDNTLNDLPPAEMKQLQQALKEEVAQMLQLAKQWEQSPAPTDSLSQ
ncbi:MAG: hypothetical protein AAF399_09015 [Bacteroidota bacterium]